MCALLGGGLTQIGMGYLLTEYGFLPPTIFITCCAVIAFLLTILLNESRIQEKADDSSRSSDELGLKEDPPMANVDKTEQRYRTKKTETGLKTILTQLREVFRIYTSNSAQCGSCDKEGTVAPLRLYTTTTHLKLNYLVLTNRFTVTLQFIVIVYWSHPASV